MCFGLKPFKMEEKEYCLSNFELDNLYHKCQLRHLIMLMKVTSEFRPRENFIEALCFRITIRRKS